MTEDKLISKPKQKARTLNEEIACQQEKLRKLQNKQRDQQRRERERNQRALMQWIQAEGLDVIPAEKWKTALPEIKAALIHHAEKTA